MARVDHNFTLFKADSQLVRKLEAGGKAVKGCVCLNCREARNDWEAERENRARLSIAQENTILKRDLLERVETGLERVPEDERKEFYRFFLARIEGKIYTEWQTWRVNRLPAPKP